jgi:hypothetical protein
MTSGEIALLVSGISLAISAGGFVWNIMQMFIYVKPTLQVTFGIYKVFGTGAPRKELCNLSVTNMGPGPAIVYACIVRERRPGSLRRQLGILNPIEGDPSANPPRSIGPFSGGLPAKLEPGEQKSFYFPFSKDGPLSESVIQFGVNDTYQRNTWCKRKYVRRAKQRFREAFLNDETRARDDKPTDGR